VRRSSGEIRFLAVVTYGRTGSTTLQAALNALPGVTIRGENYGALRGLHDYVQALAETADRHHAGRPAHPWFGSARLRPDDVLTSLRSHVLETVLRPPRDSTWVGFKEVRYEPGHFATYDELLEFLLFLDKLLPGIRFLINVRDPESAARSGWWPEHDDARGALRESRERLGRAAEDLAELLGADRVVLIDYDEWVARPDVVTRAFRTLGLPRDDEAVREALDTRLAHGQHGDGSLAQAALEEGRRDDR